MSDPTGIPIVTIQPAAEPTAVKPAYKSTEAWLSLGTAVFGALVSAGFIADGSKVAQICGFVLTAAGMAFHSWSRTTLKAAA